MSVLLTPFAGPEVGGCRGIPGPAASPSRCPGRTPPSSNIPCHRVSLFSQMPFMGTTPYVDYSTDFMGITSIGGFTGPVLALRDGHYGPHYRKLCQQLYSYQNV